MRWLLAITVCGCAGHAGVVDRPARPEASHAAAAGAPVDLTIPLGGGANALWWDAASSTLYLTDSNASSLVTWSDASGLQTAAVLPADAAGVSLGGIVRQGDGTLLIASFGFGAHGGMFALTNGTPRALTGLDATRRRVGLAQDTEGKLYSAYFVGGRGSPPVGGVAVVTLAGSAATETEIAGGLHKAVGVVATPSTVFVSDQTAHAIYKIAVPGYAVTKLADVPAVDLLAMLPNGDLMTGGGPTIWRITPAGQVTPLLAGFEQVRGLAYDDAGKRLFVIDHSVTAGIPDKLRVVRIHEP